MRILIVASYNKGFFAPFIVEQGDCLQAYGHQVHYCGIVGKGLIGYLKAFPKLKNVIAEFQPDVIHAHYGLCGLLANLQRRIPVVTTYHGSDINEKSVLPFSKLAIHLSAHNIFVSQRTIDIAKPRRHYSLIPCGVNLFEIMDKTEARDLTGLKSGMRYVLFAGAFDNAVKNYPLAKKSVELLDDVELLELKGYSREDVNCLMCAADAIVMTSFAEGSPQVVKEAMTFGLPVVSVDVGDVADIISGVAECFVAERSPSSIAACLKEAFHFNRTSGRERIIELGLDNDTIIDKIISVYESVNSSNNQR